MFAIAWQVYHTKLIHGSQCFHIKFKCQILNEIAKKKLDNAGGIKS